MNFSFATQVKQGQVLSCKDGWEKDIIQCDMHSKFVSIVIIIISSTALQKKNKTEKRVFCACNSLNVLGVHGNHDTWTLKACGGGITVFWTQFLSFSLIVPDLSRTRMHVNALGQLRGACECCCPLLVDRKVICWFNKVQGTLNSCAVCWKEEVISQSTAVKHKIWSWAIWVKKPALLRFCPSACVISDRLLYLSEPQFLSFVKWDRKSVV